MVNEHSVLQSEMFDFFCRFSEARILDGEMVGWTIMVRRNPQRSMPEAHFAEWFTKEEDDWGYLPLTWEPT